MFSIHDTHNTSNNEPTRAERRAENARDLSGYCQRVVIEGPEW